MTSKLEPNNLWSLYAQTVVRFVYYASERFSDRHELVDFEQAGNYSQISPAFIDHMLILE